MTVSGSSTVIEWIAGGPVTARNRRYSLNQSPHANNNDMAYSLLLTVIRKLFYMSLYVFITVALQQAVADEEKRKKEEAAKSEMKPPTSDDEESDDDDIDDELKR